MFRPQSAWAESTASASRRKRGTCTQCTQTSESPLPLPSPPPLPFPSPPNPQPLHPCKILTNVYTASLQMQSKKQTWQLLTHAPHMYYVIRHAFADCWHVLYSGLPSLCRTGGALCDIADALCIAVMRWWHTVQRVQIIWFTFQMVQIWQENKQRHTVCHKRITGGAWCITDVTQCVNSATYRWQFSIKNIEKMQSLCILYLSIYILYIVLLLSIPNTVFLFTSQIYLAHLYLIYNNLFLNVSHTY